MSDFAIKADQFFLPGGVSGPGYLGVSDGKVGFYSTERPDGEIVDCSGSWVSPGLVDTHIHGFLDHDALDGEPEGISAICQGLARYGVTSWLPTVLTASVEQIADACATIVAADDAGGAHVRGIFLEGPFFTEEHKGAQNPKYFSDPSVDTFHLWQDKAQGTIKKIAIAPERAGSLAFTKQLVSEGVHVALAHTNATFDEAMAAVNAGADVFIHTYDAMSPLNHRMPGTVGAAMVSRGTYAEIICDGHHVDPAAIRALVQAKGIDWMVLITDCLRCGGMPEGDYFLGELPVEIRDGAAHLKEGGNLAGSILTLDAGVRNIVRWGIATPENALRMATVNPARANGIGDVCGSLLPGRDADIVVFSPSLEVERTYVSGTCVYEKGEQA